MKKLFIALTLLTLLTISLFAEMKITESGTYTLTGGTIIYVVIVRLDDGASFTISYNEVYEDFTYYCAVKTVNEIIESSDIYVSEYSDNQTTNVLITDVDNDILDELVTIE